MSLEAQAKTVKKSLRKAPKSAAEIAQANGFNSGRAISRALNQLVSDGQATVVDGRTKKYARA